MKSSLSTNLKKENIIWNFKSTYGVILSSKLQQPVHNKKKYLFENADNQPEQKKAS